MSASALTVGYPVHAVAEYTEWENQHKAAFTDWKAACGAMGTKSGRSDFGRAYSARKQELCPACFPGRDAKTPHPEPRRVLL